MKLAGVEGLGDVGVGGVWGGEDDVGEVRMVSACCSCGEWDWACVKEVGCFRELLGSSNVSFSLSSR